MSTTSMDPYKVLGVAKEAQIPEIRSAHRKLILKCHPDKVQDPELKAQKQDEFQKVQQAYEILSDENQRQKYDDKIRLAELRQQYQNRANASAPRSAPQVFEVRTVDPSTRGSAPNVKVHTSYSRSYEDERRSRSYYEGDIRLPRRENTYSEKPSKSDRDRKDDREKEKRRAARKEREAAEEQRRAEKAAKDKEKKRQEKQRTKDVKRSKEEKQRERTAPYIEPFDDPPRRRERSRGETPPREMPLPPEAPSSGRVNFARAYISRSRTDMGPDRSYSHRFQEPIPEAVPTPPPAGVPFAPPSDEDEVRRSAARPRRGSDIPPMSRERSYRKPSVEPHEDDPRDPYVVNASPAARKASRHVDPGMYGSPPRNLHRTQTAPMPASSRNMPPRSQTYNGPIDAEYANGNRGRYRSKKQAQVAESSDESEDYDPPPRRSKHRSSRKTRSPEGGAAIRYHVGDDGRTTKIPAQTYTRNLHAEPSSYYYDAPPPRPSYPAREASYANSSFKVRTGKSYDYGDIQYSHYDAPSYYSRGMPTGA